MAQGGSLAIDRAQIVPKTVEHLNSFFLVIKGQMGVSLIHLQRFVPYQLHDVLERNYSLNHAGRKRI